MGITARFTGLGFYYDENEIYLEEFIIKLNSYLEQLVENNDLYLPSYVD